MKNIFSSFDNKNINKNLITQADALRDAGKFSDAAALYAEYLANNPSDFGIWVQRGNCLKDSGQYETAEIAYQAAISLKPDDSDVYLQMGHLQKLMNNSNKAILYYKKSISLDQKQIAAAIELRNLGFNINFGNEGSGLDLDKNIISFDITDLLSFLRQHEKVTGIQRVQSEIIRSIIKKDSNLIHSNNIQFVFYDFNKNLIYSIFNDGLQDLLDLLDSNSFSRSDLNNILNMIELKSYKYIPRLDDIYIIIGAYWIGPDYGTAILNLRQAGTKVGIYIYDLIPITHPQFVTESTRQDVIEKFGTVMALCDFALTISDFVANELKFVLNTDLKRDIPIISAPLAHELPKIAQSNTDKDIDFIENEDIPDEFVLCVCTLEGRKNHLLLLECWKSLYNKYGDNTPYLVLVGKWGWRIDEFKEKLIKSNNVNGKILVLGNISDALLKFLYEKCLFTIFPSFVEGWGLPVGESLSHGKPCIASNTSSIPEVGGEFCRYINPYDLISSLAVIEKTITDRTGLREWQNKIRQTFKPRTWDDLALDFLSKVNKVVPKIQTRKTLPTSLIEGEYYKINYHSIFDDTEIRKDRILKFILFSGWDNLDPWGVWSKLPKAKIAFGTNLKKGENVRVLVELRVPPSLRDDVASVQIVTNKKRINLLFKDANPHFYVLTTEVDEFGNIVLEIERSRNIEHIDPARPIFVGLSGIAYYSMKNIEARLDLMESLSGIVRI